MSDPNPPTRKPNVSDRLCDKCGEPMIGIMKCSDYGEFAAPRKVCEPCGGKSVHCGVTNASGS